MKLFSVIASTALASVIPDYPIGMGGGIECELDQLVDVTCDTWGGFKV